MICGASRNFCSLCFFPSEIFLSTFIGATDTTHFFNAPLAATIFGGRRLFRTRQAHDQRGTHPHRQVGAGLAGTDHQNDHHRRLFLCGILPNRQSEEIVVNQKHRRNGNQKHRRIGGILAKCPRNDSEKKYFNKFSQEKKFKIFSDGSLSVFEFFSLEAVWYGAWRLKKCQNPKLSPKTSF